MKAQTRIIRSELPSVSAVVSLLLLSGLLYGGAQTITPLPTLGGSMASASALNGRGQVAGFSFLPGNVSQRAYFYSAGSIADLGTLGGGQSQAIGLNNAGQVIGDASTVNDLETHAFLFQGGTLIDLGTLGGAFSTAVAVNEAGQVAGYSYLRGNNELRAFLHTGGALVDLGTLGGTFSSAVDVNSQGQVIGIATTAYDLETHPFLYSQGRMIDLGTLGGPTASAFDLNDAGLVVGDSLTDDYETHAFLYLGGTMFDLGTLGGSFSSAFAISELGQIIGHSFTSGDGEDHAFLHAGGAMQDLGTLGGTYSLPYALNNRGQVVGDATDASENTLPFLWQNGTMADLNSLLPPNSQWQLFAALCINDAGQILGYGLYQGSFAWYLMTLPSPNRPPVAEAGPEQILECPGTITLDGSGSSDPDGDALSFAWRHNGTLVGQEAGLTLNLPPGVHTFHLTVADPAGQSAEDAVTVTIADLTPPTITCPLLHTLAAGPEGSVAVPDLTRSVVAIDNCADPASLRRAQSPAVGTLLSPGEYSVTVTVTDLAGNPASCATRLVVEKPVCQLVFDGLSASPPVLQPPNKQMVPIVLVPKAASSCAAPLRFEIVSVTSEEVGAGRKSNVSPDWEITGPLSLKLRSELSPQASFRVYTITVLCSDNAGNKAQQATQVFVQKNKSTESVPVLRKALAAQAGKRSRR